MKKYNDSTIKELTTEAVFHLGESVSKITTALLDIKKFRQQKPLRTVTEVRLALLAIEIQEFIEYWEDLK